MFPDYGPDCHIFLKEHKRQKVSREKKKHFLFLSYYNPLIKESSWANLFRVEEAEGSYFE
jgi:hypothetical protein